MAETAAANAIVPEVLNKDNYEEWKFRLQTYLMAQDLWDVITKDQPIGLKEFMEAKGIARTEDLKDGEKANDEASKEVQSEPEIKAWLKKNATALHVIHISCGRDAFGAIFEITSAKFAWKTLQDKLEEPIINTDENFAYRPFFHAVETDNWSSAQEFLNEHPEALRLRHPLSGRTALHVAALYGHKQMVKKLMQVMLKYKLVFEPKNEAQSIKLQPISPYQVFISTSILSQSVSTESSQNFVVWKNEYYCGMIYGVICGVINGVFVFFVFMCNLSSINTPPSVCV